MAKQLKGVIKQAFFLKAPEATSVMIAGDFTDWQSKPIRLKKQSGGLWKTTVSLPSGTYHYRFLVDGQWRDDPQCALRVPNPFGTEDAVVIVASETKS